MDEIELVYNYAAQAVHADNPLTLNYQDYLVVPNSTFKKRAYTLSLELKDGTILEIPNTYLLMNDNAVDDHATIMIENRTISIIDDSFTLVAEDNRSQLITFSIHKYYDGISFLDESKSIYIDYVPAGYKPIDDEPAFFSDEIKTRYIDSTDENRIILEWLVPYGFTQFAGDVLFSLAVIGLDGYVWQTFPTKVEVKKNLGLRPNSPVIPTDPEDNGTLEKRLLALEDYVANVDGVSSINEETGTLTTIEKTDGVETTKTYNVADLYENAMKDNEMILISGGSDVEEG